jgi:hypothetical protein
VTSKNMLMQLTMFLGLLTTNDVVLRAQSPSLSIDPSPAFMGKIPLGSDQSQDFTILNLSSSMVNVSKITLVGSSKEKFSVVNNPTPYQMAPFEELVLTVKYTPTTADGDMAIMQIETGGGIVTDTLRAFGTKVASGLPTFERLLGKRTISIGGKTTIVTQSVSSLAQTADGGFVMVGQSKDISGGHPTSAMLIKTDKYGKFEWERDFCAGASGGSYGGAQDAGNDVLVLDDGSIVVIGGTRSWGSGNRDAYLSKWKANGDFLWEKAYGGTLDDGGSKVIKDDHGDLVVVGFTRSTADQKSNLYVLKISPIDGTLIWKLAYNADGIESGADVVATTDGGYMAVGNALSPTANICFVKIDHNGNQQWHKVLISSIQSQAGAIKSTSDGGYVVSGYTFTNDKGIDGYLVKVDSNAGLQWSKSFGTVHIDKFNSLVTTADNGYLCIGSINQYFSIENVYDDLWLLKTDSKGNMLWEKRFGGDLNDSGNDIIKTAEGGYAFIGGTASFNNDPTQSRIYFLEVNLDGNITDVNETRNRTREIPLRVSLHQNYPNPFNPTTTIPFSVPARSFVSLIVYDALGREVAVLRSQELPAGEYLQRWNATMMPSGVYFCRLQSDGFTEMRKLVLLK